MIIFFFSYPFPALNVHILGLMLIFIGKFTVCKWKQTKGKENDYLMWDIKKKNHGEHINVKHYVTLRYFCASPSRPKLRFYSPIAS